jgi:trimeric autotransporter adhesin
MKLKVYVFLFTGITAFLYSLDGYSQANTTLSNLVAPTAINQSLLPNTANTRDLGSAARRWRLFYFDSAIYMKTILTIHARGTGNFFAGQQSGNLTLTGNSNSGFGQLTLNKLTSGVNNAAIGYRALALLTTGNSNAAVGREAAVNTTTGSFNTALGFQSMFTNTTGAYNVAAGFQASYFNKTGANNVAIGPKALMKNVAGNYLVAIGDSALFSNTGNYGNVAVGSKALYKNTTGYYNVALGYQALYSNTTSGYNTALGYQALYLTTGSAYDNTGSGFQALYANTSGSRNTADGVWALLNNTTGSNNVADGVYALQQNTSGNDNVAMGYFANYYNNGGNSNVAIGSHALFSATGASNIVAIGDSALYFTTTTGASLSTAVGTKALYANTSGLYNTSVGSRASYSNTTGSYNTSVGTYASYLTTTGTSNAAFGTYAAYSNTGSYNTSLGAYAGYYASNNCTFVGWDTYGATFTPINSTAVGYHAPTTASNQVRLGDANVTSIGGAVGFSVISDGRFKKNIQEDVPGLDFVNKLRPVTYNLDAMAIDKTLAEMTKRPGEQPKEMSDADRSAAESKSKIKYTGFVAQEVEATAKKMNYDFSGVDAPKNDKDFYGLRYADFVVPLVKAVQELSQKNDDKDQKIATLEARIEKLEQLLKLNGTGAVMSNATLDQNTPNPVRNRTTIGYNLPDQFANAQIQLTDNAGKLLKRITLSGSGRGVVNLDAFNLAAGTYHYTLLVDGRQIETKQMIVTR